MIVKLLQFFLEHFNNHRCDSFTSGGTHYLSHEELNGVLLTGLKFFNRFRVVIETISLP